MTGVQAFVIARALSSSGCMVPEAGNVPIFIPSEKPYVTILSGRYSIFICQCCPKCCPNLGAGRENSCRCRSSYLPETSEANLKKVGL